MTKFHKKERNVTYHKANPSILSQIMCFYIYLDEEKQVYKIGKRGNSLKFLENASKNSAQRCQGIWSLTLKINNCKHQNSTKSTLFPQLSRINDNLPKTRKRQESQDWVNVTLGMSVHVKSLRAITVPPPPVFKMSVSQHTLHFSSCSCVLIRTTAVS